MTITVFLIRVLPLTIIRKKINNKYVQSFLYYLPYVTLAVMTFPSIIDATSNPLGGIVALLLAIGASYKKQDMFVVTVICCVSILIVEMFV